MDRESKCSSADTIVKEEMVIFFLNTYSCHLCKIFARAIQQQIQNIVENMFAHFS